MHWIDPYYISSDWKYLISKESIYMSLNIKFFEIDTQKIYDFYEMIDKNREIVKEYILKIDSNVDSDSLEFLDNYFIKDKNYIYKNYFSSLFKLDNIDINTFSSLNGYLFKDSNWVYKVDSPALLDYEVKKIPDADIETFEIIDISYSKDKNNVYYYWEKMEWINVKELEILTNWYIRDNNNCYYYSRKVDMSQCENLTQ